MDDAAKKRLLRSVPYGLYAGCTRGTDGAHQVFILSWFTQCSFDPPRVVIGVHRQGKGYRNLDADGKGAPLTVNFLCEDQQALATALLKGPGFEDETVAGTPWREAANGCALLPASLGALELEVVHEVPGGDHAAFVCEVVGAHGFREGALMTHASTGWHYGG